MFGCLHIELDQLQKITQKNYASSPQKQKLLPAWILEYSSPFGHILRVYSKLNKTIHFELKL